MNFFDAAGAIPMIRGLLVAGAISLLTGCISLFPQADPIQLYRFGTTSPPVQEVASGEPGFGVLLSNTGFDRAAAGDRILTVTGTQAAYVKDARWVTSAVALFDSAVQNAFDADQGPVRLVAQGEIARADYVLKLDVRTFEAEYDKGQNSAPMIVVELHAALNRTHNQTVAGDHSFTAAVAARDNRVGAIADAFDQAVSQVLGELAAWVNARGSRGYGPASNHSRGASE